MKTETVQEERINESERVRRQYHRQVNRILSSTELTADQRENINAYYKHLVTGETRTGVSRKITTLHAAIQPVFSFAKFLQNLFDFDIVFPALYVFSFDF